MHDLPLNSGDEYDCFTRWRRYVKSFQRAGKTARIKRGYRRRCRRHAKRECRP